MLRRPESEIKRILWLKEERIVLGYVRLPTQRDDLEGQIVASYARGYGEVQVISDVGSGLNEERAPEALGMVPGEGFKDYRCL